MNIFAVFQYESILPFNFYNIEGKLCNVLVSYELHKKEMCIQLQVMLLPCDVSN